MELSKTKDNENYNYNIIQRSTPESIIIEQKLGNLRTKEEQLPVEVRQLLWPIHIENNKVKYTFGSGEKEKKVIEGLSNSELWSLFANRDIMLDSPSMALFVAENLNDNRLLEYIVINAKRIFGKDKLHYLQILLDKKDDVNLLVSCAQNYQTSGIIPKFLNKTILKNIKDGNKENLEKWIIQYEKFGLESGFLMRIIASSKKIIDLEDVNLNELTLYEVLKKSNDEELIKYCSLNGKYLGLESEQILDILNLQNIEDKRESIYSLIKNGRESGLKPEHKINIITDLYRTTHEDENEEDINLNSKRLSDDRFLEECVFKKEEIGLENRGIIDLIRLRNRKEFTEKCLKNIEKLNINRDEYSLEETTNYIIKVLELLDPEDIINEWIFNKENGKILGSQAIYDVIRDMNRRLYRNKNGQLQLEEGYSQYTDHKIFEVNGKKVNLLELVRNNIDETCLKGYNAYDMIKDSKKKSEEVVQSIDLGTASDRLNILDEFCYNLLKLEITDTEKEELFKKHLKKLGVDIDFTDILNNDQFDLTQEQQALIKMLPSNISNIKVSGEGTNYEGIAKFLNNFFQKCEKYKVDIYNISANFSELRSRKDICELIKFCNTFSSLGYSSKKGVIGGVTVNTESLNTESDWWYFLKLYANIEPILYLITNECENVPSRLQVEGNIKPSKEDVVNLLENEKNFLSTTENSTNLEKAKLLLKEGLDKGIQMNKSDDISFNMVMTSLNSEENMKNMILLGRVIEMASELSRISNKQLNERTQEEKEKMEIFEEIMESNSNEEKLRYLLQLIIPIKDIGENDGEEKFAEQIRKDFLKRYYINRETLTKTPEGQTVLYDLGIEPIHMGLFNKLITTRDIGKVTMEQSKNDILKIEESINELLVEEQGSNIEHNY